MQRKVTDEQISEIKQLLASKRYGQKEIAKQFNISRSLVSDIATKRIHSKVGEDYQGKKQGGQYKPLPLHDPTDSRILSLEAEVAHLKEERTYIKKQLGSAIKTYGLFNELVDELQHSIQPLEALPNLFEFDASKEKIVEPAVLHLSDGHHDQVVTKEECGGLEEYNFPISMRRAEVLVGTALKWTQQIMAPSYTFPSLTILSYGDHTSGEIHNHTQRSYFRNIFKNCLAIGQLHALMIRDFAPYFHQVNVVCVPGNHGRRSIKKDYHGAHDNWDYLIAEITQLHCRGLKNVNFLIPNSYSVKLDIAGVGFCIFHGDDIRSNLGIPWYGLQKKQQKILALNSIQGGTRIRYNCCGHFHTPASLGGMDGAMMINGPWVATDSYAYHSFGGFTEPTQLLHGVDSRYGVTWKLPIYLRTDNEARGPQRYTIPDFDKVSII